KDGTRPRPDWPRAGRASTGTRGRAKKIGNLLLPHRRGLTITPGRYLIQSGRGNRAVEATATDHPLTPSPSPRRGKGGNKDDAGANSYPVRPGEIRSRHRTPLLL